MTGNSLISRAAHARAPFFPKRRRFGKRSALCIKFFVGEFRFGTSAGIETLDPLPPASPRRFSKRSAPSNNRDIGYLIGSNAATSLGIARKAGDFSSLCLRNPDRAVAAYCRVFSAGETGSAAPVDIESLG
jgi:hypothetical protein